MVDVHFLTGTETTGFNLHINGEGAGVAKQGRLVRALGKSWKHQVLGLANFCSIYWIFVYTLRRLSGCKIPRAPE